MTQENTNKPQNDANDLVVTRGFASLLSIWLVPIVALFIGGWLLFQAFLEKGPDVVVKFNTAESIEVGKTKVRYKQVDVGVVEKLSVTEDLSGVEVTIAFNAGAEDFLNEDTRFWVVRPRIGAKGISGLTTLVSGSYVEIDPGKGDGYEDYFIGLEDPPVIRASTPGKTFTLASDRLGSITEGSPVSYHGLNVGEVLGYRLDQSKRFINVEIFIHAPYDELVRPGSHFWNASGIDMSLNANGVDIRTESIQSILLGGVAFDTPINLLAAKPVEDGHRFSLYASQEVVNEVQYSYKENFVMYFRGSVRGLSVNAPVEFKGIRIGKVIDINLEANLTTGEYFIPVLIEIEPERITLLGGELELSEVSSVPSLVEKGLRGQLKMGSLLTGQLFVELGFFKDMETIVVNRSVDYPEIPTVDQDLDAILGSVSSVLAKVEQMPLEELGESLLRSAQGLEKVLTSPDIEELPSELHLMVNDVRRLVDTLTHLSEGLDAETLPKLNNVLSEAENTLIGAEKVVASAQSMISENSPMRYDLATMLRELSAAARSIRNLTAYLERNPSALISGKQNSGAAQ